MYIILHKELMLILRDTISLFVPFEVSNWGPSMNKKPSSESYYETAGAEGRRKFEELLGIKNRTQEQFYYTLHNHLKNC